MNDAVKNYAIGLAFRSVVIICMSMLPQMLVAQVDSVSVANDSTATLEEGFIGATSGDIDYDALVEELYGEEKPAVVKVQQETVLEPKVKGRPDRRGPAPGLFKRSRINGAHLAFSGASPFAVSAPLESWYSHIDASFTLKLPFEVYVESIPLYLLLEVSSFSFENSYPEGGDFKGLAYIFQASSIGESSGAVIGFGVWDRNLGSMLEVNYRFRPTKNTFLRFATRGVLITDLDPLGPVWWVELRISTGIEL